MEDAHTADGDEEAAHEPEPPAEGEGGEGAAGDADPRAEGEGETLGEAKWAAVKVLEGRFPGLTADAVSFEVLDRSEDGPARVAAIAEVETWRAESRSVPEEPAERVRAMVTRVVSGLGLRASVDIDADDEEIRATVNGDDLGLLIGKHGTTIDAVQHLALRAAFREGDERRRIVVDAAGYRDRREAVLRRTADKAVEDALSFGRPVELEPMSSQERKVVHNYLAERTDVETHSEGDEPDRRLVVSPVGA